MKHLLQRLDTGATWLEESPVPVPKPSCILVRSEVSAVSPGTERMVMRLARSSLIRKAWEQPERVRAVLEKARLDGIGPTMEAVRAKLSHPIALGYCNAGVVVEMASDLQAFEVGDRVVTNGPHAEYVSVPWTLAAVIPKAVSFEYAAFAPLAAVGTQALRVADVRFGETVVVYGLGLVGLLTVQLAKAAGSPVLGVDILDERLALAERFGAIPIRADRHLIGRVRRKTNGVGADAVLLTLEAESNEPLHNAAAMSRKKGRIVLVGVTGMTLRREDYYEKELSFAVSCSYGPGRYDPSYEERGVDYPLPYVRWTAKRNFEAVLQFMAEGKVDPAPLITDRFPFEEAERAYDALLRRRQVLGIVLQYSHHDEQPATAPRVVRTSQPARSRSGICRAGIIGAGSFAQRTVLPILKELGVEVQTIASRSGTDAALAGRKFGIPEVTSDSEYVLRSDCIDTVFVLTRHNTHAELARRALERGKHVFVEKPLGINQEELSVLKEVALRSDRLLTVGFNRRFADLTLRAAKHLDGRVGPVSLIITVNAGPVAESHWVRDPEVGGGRIVGEACHFIDLARALVDVPIVALYATPASTCLDGSGEDGAHVLLRFGDGSTAVVHYLANGPRALPKERVECFFESRGLVIENWRRIRTYGMGGTILSLPRRQDKGHRTELRSWVRSVQSGGPPPIPLNELFEVSEYAVQAAELASRR